MHTNCTPQSTTLLMFRQKRYFYSGLAEGLQLLGELLEYVASHSWLMAGADGLVHSDAFLFVGVSENGEVTVNLVI